MLSENKIIPNVCKIAVLRANGIGDFIFALPALQALRNAYPRAEIVLLAKDWHAAFLRDRSGPIDRVIIIPPVKGVGVDPNDSHSIEDPAEQARFFANMRCEHFDLAVQMHGGGRYSNAFLLRLGACMTIGLKTPDAAPLDRWVPYIYFQPEIVRYLEVVSLVGATAVTLEPHIVLLEKDLVEAQSIVPDKGKSLLALHPGAGGPDRRWPAEKFAAVGDATAAAGVQIVVTGTPAENDLVEAVTNNMKAEALNLCGRLSLGGLAGLLSRCNVVISNDSGPLHLAAAVGTATVGIFWCVNQITAGMLMRTRHRPLISWRLACPICGSNQIVEPCQHCVSYVADITTEEVVRAALELLSSANSLTAR